MITVPVTVEFLQVEVITLHGLFAILDYLYRSLVECDRSQSWQRSQALLAACIASVDLHFIGIHGNAAKSTDRIYYE